MRRLLLVLVLIVLSACGTSPESLSGEWRTTDNSPNIVMLADVDQKIEVFWIQDGLRALYWKGTIPTEVTPGETFVSEGDIDAMSSSLLASLDETKKFKYDEGQLTFELGMMGIVYDIAMERSE